MRADTSINITHFSRVVLGDRGSVFVEYIVLLSLVILTTLAGVVMYAHSISTAFCFLENTVDRTTPSWFINENIQDGTSNSSGRDIFLDPETVFCVPRVGQDRETMFPH